jgi:hypothetical protein
MTSSRSSPEDMPLRLAAAAELVFGQDGGMTASGLRKEAQRGRLVIERIAGKDFTTLRAIADMRRLCQLAPKSRLAAKAKGDDAQERARRAIAKLRASTSRK